MFLKKPKSDAEESARARRKWQYRDPLETSDWSLLRASGLTQKQARIVHCVWLTYVLVFCLSHRQSLEVYFLVWCISAMTLNYILQRLQGVPAYFDTDPVTEQDAFQFRLVMDTASLLLMLFFVCAVAFGLIGA